jgi:acetyl esterase/lipase
MKLKIFLSILLFNNICCAQFSTTYNISYNKINDEFSPLLSLDIHTPQTGKDFPVIIFIHGGGWQIGDKTSIAHLNKRNFFVNRGFIFVSVNYRLAPNDFYPTYPQDVAQAIAFVFDWIAKFKGDSNKIFIMGHSAGAHLAALVATDESYLSIYGHQPKEIKGVILLDGAGYDIPAAIDFQSQNDNTAAVAMFHTAFGNSENIWFDASPINHINQQYQLPAFQLFYVNTRAISTLLSNTFADKITTSGNQAQTIAVANTTHANINKNFGAQGDTVSLQALEFINTLIEIQ